MKSTHDTFGYSAMIHEALRGVVRKVLQKTQDFGMPPEHYFYITFKTMAQQVVLPLYLRQKYPESMTIVLQYQFQNLRVGEKGFSVALGFSGKFENLYIPFSAVEMFSDPKAELVLSFQENTKEKTQDNALTPNQKSLEDNNSQTKISNLKTDSHSSSNNPPRFNAPNGLAGDSIGNHTSGSSSDSSGDANWLGTISYGLQKPLTNQKTPKDAKQSNLKQVETKEKRAGAKVLEFPAKNTSIRQDKPATETKSKSTRKTKPSKTNSSKTKPKNKSNFAPQSAIEDSSQRNPEDSNNDSPSP